MKTLLLLLTCLQAPIFPVTAKEEKPGPVKESGTYLVVFTASWCGPCQQWKANEKPKLDGVAVTTVDIDEQRQWGVTTVPSFWVVDRATRKPLKKFTGSTSAATLLKELQPIQPQIATDKQVKIEPTEERRILIEHLLNDGIHAGRHTHEKLTAMSLEDLETLHNLEHNSGPTWYVKPRQVQPVRRRRGLFFEWR